MFAFVTGASSGAGEAFARQLAGMDRSRIPFPVMRPDEVAGAARYVMGPGA